MEYGDLTIQDQAAVSPIAKIGLFTRDTTLASGTQAVTGVGFKPSMVMFFSNGQTTEISWGADTDGTALYMSQTPTPGTFEGSGGATLSIRIDDSGGEYQGSIDTMDTDGFTINWTKVSSPTGTAQIKYLAFK